MKKEYSYYDFDPFKNTLYQNFYDKLFSELKNRRVYRTEICFPDKCQTIHSKVICIPYSFIRLLNTSSMQSSYGKIQTAHSYKLNARMIDSRYEHMCFTYILGVDLLIILEKNGYAIDAKNKITFLIKLLLHDIGHGPFSHPFEQMIDGYKGLHEDIGARNIAEDKEISSILEQIYPGLTDNIIHFNENDPYGLHELVEGIFDLDRAAFLILDTWLSNDNLYSENNYEELEKLITSIYHIFENIILKYGHVYYDKKCLPDIENFIAHRTFNYANLYQDKSRVLDDLILHEVGVELINTNEPPASLSNLLSPVEQFKYFLANAKEKQQNLNLDTYYSYTDSDLEKIVRLATIYDNPRLSFYGNLFLAPYHYMINPFNIHTFTDEEEYHIALSDMHSLLHTTNNIKVYKSTEQEHIVFYDTETSTYTDFKDMENRRLSIKPLEEYLIFSKKSSEELPSDSLLRTYFLSYLQNNISKVLFDCEYCLNVDENPINRLILQELITILSSISKTKSFKTSAQEKDISLNQLYTILSFYTFDRLWHSYTLFLTSSKEELSLFFEELSFSNIVERDTFISELTKIIQDNITQEDVVNPNNDLILKEMVITIDNTIFLNKAILNSMKLSPSSKERINNLLKRHKMLIKEYK